jgi:hypothetical protein
MIKFGLKNTALMSYYFRPVARDPATKQLVINRLVGI